MSRTARGSLVVATLLLVVTACSSDEPSHAPPEPPAGPSDDPPDPPEPPAPPERDVTAAEPAWRLPLDLVSQPAAADGVALTLVTEGRDLRLVAVDAATGERLWAQPWSPGGVPAGYGVEAETFTDADGAGVAVVSVPPSGDAQDAASYLEPLAVLDLRTGRERFRTDPVRLLTPPTPCADDADACFTVRDDDAGARGVRLDLASGTLGSDGTGPPTGARSIGDDGLFATSDRPGERLGVRRDGRILWSTDIDSLVGPGVSTDSGWAFDHDVADDVYVGWLRRPLDPENRELAESGAPFVYQAEDLVLVAFDGATGERLWRSVGAYHTCLGGSVIPEDEAPLVRCLPQGRVRYADGRVVTVERAAVSVEGMDPATGETTWSVELSTPQARGILSDEDVRPLSDARTVVLATRDGTSLVDLVSGARSDVPDGTVFACQTPVEPFDYARVRNASETTTTFGGATVGPCTADGADADAFTVAAILEGGVDAGDGLRVVGRPGALEGYRTGG